eukprot:COSAG02_NODE_1584_length_11821_cov_11.601604_9_plen_96_part_00
MFATDINVLALGVQRIDNQWFVSFVPCNAELSVFTCALVCAIARWSKESTPDVYKGELGGTLPSEQDRLQWRLTGGKVSNPRSRIPNLRSVNRSE